MQIDEIRRLVRAGHYEVSIHAQQERLEDDLDVSEIETAILTGEVIEDYPDDPPVPVASFLDRRGARPCMWSWGGHRPEVKRNGH